MADIVQQHSSLPIIGNGDILTHFEASNKWQSTGVAGVMVGRGALMKPWIFQEIKQVRLGLTFVADAFIGHCKGSVLCADVCRLTDGGRYRVGHAA